MRGRNSRRRAPLARWAVAAASLSVVLLATGCLTLTNHNQSCTSSGGLLGPSEFSCSGTVETVKGEGPLTFDSEDDNSPDFRMNLTASVESGRMDVLAGTSDGGEVSPGNPVEIQAVVPSSDEDVSITLSVKGGDDAEVGGLRYEASFVEVG